MSDNEQWIISVDWPALPWGGHLGKITKLGGNGFDRPYSVRIGRIYSSEEEAKFDFMRAYNEEVRPKLEAQMKEMGMAHIPSLTEELNALLRQHYPLLRLFMGQQGWWIMGILRDCHEMFLGTDETYVRQIASGEIVPDWIVR